MKILSRLLVLLLIPTVLLIVPVSVCFNDPREAINRYCFFLRKLWEGDLR